MRILVFIVFTLISLLGFGQEKEVKLAESMSQGSEIYSDFCMRCHLEEGEGIIGSFPPLAASDFLAQYREESIRAVKFGLRGKITVNGTAYNNIMIPMGLEDQEIADVMNYVMNSWGNSSKEMVTVEEVEAIVKKKKTKRQRQ